MSRRPPAERLEAIEGLLEELRDRGPEVAVLVEGDRDLAALRTLEVPGPLIKVNVGESLLNLCERISGRFDGFVLLTDWDAKGSELAGKLRTYLESAGCDVDVSVRNRLGALVRYETREVEALPSHLSRLRARAGTDQRRPSLMLKRQGI